MDLHTKAKHDILEEYLKQWFPILSSTTERIIYLDGFAGPGIYDKGEEGSPIIAIKTAVEHKFADKFKGIIFWFIEKDLERAKKLEQVIKSKFPSLPEKFQYEVEKSEFAPSLAETLDEIEKERAKLAPTFAFIDPSGFSGMPMNLIARILEYKKCEILINFMTSFINRFHDKEGALDDLFGTREWRKIYEINDPDKGTRSAVDFYVEQLRERGANFYRTFEMIRDNNQTLYHLVFVTKNLAGLRAMKEAMMKVDQRGTFKFSDRTDPKQTFLSNYSDLRNWVPQASKLVHNEFAGKIATVEDVEELVLTKTPFVFRKAILKELEKNGKIIGVEGRKRGGSFPKNCIITFSK